MCKKENKEQMASDREKGIKEKKETKVKKEKKVTISRQEYEQFKEEAKKGQESHDRLLRVCADYENARKRLEKEKQEYVNYANEKLVVDLLSIIDDLERAMTSADKGDNLEHVIQGVKMIKSQFFAMLKSAGLEKIKVKDEKFNPHLHEAIDFVETDEYDEDEIVEVLQSGYLFKGRLLRPAVVKIAKNNKQKPEDRNQKIEEKEEAD